MSFENEDEEREREIQAVNPLASVNNTGMTNQTEQVDFLSGAGAQKISDFMAANPGKAGSIAKMIASSAGKGSSKIHLPVSKNTLQSGVTADISTASGMQQLSAFVTAHPGKAEDILSRIADAAKIGTTKIKLPMG